MKKTAKKTAKKNDVVGDMRKFYQNQNYRAVVSAQQQVHRSVHDLWAIRECVDMLAIKPRVIELAIDGVREELGRIGRSLQNVINSPQTDAQIRKEVKSLHLADKRRAAAIERANAAGGSNDDVPF